MAFNSSLILLFSQYAIILTFIPLRVASCNKFSIPNFFERIKTSYSENRTRISSIDDVIDVLMILSISKDFEIFFVNDFPRPYSISLIFSLKGNAILHNESNKNCCAETNDLSDTANNLVLLFALERNVIKSVLSISIILHAI